MAMTGVSILKTITESTQLKIVTKITITIMTLKLQVSIAIYIDDEDICTCYSPASPPLVIHH